MARIGEVWDSTVDAARGRGAMIAPIALGAFFLPGIVQNAITAFGGTGPAVGILTLLVVLGTVILAGWGQLAIIAIVTDPATTRGDAIRQANRRLGPALANAIALLALVLVVLLPFFVSIALSGIDWAAMQQAQTGSPAAFENASRGSVLFASFYLLAFVLFSFWLSARVLLTYAVALNERRGLGAIGRSVALTRGMTWKLIGVLILYAVVLIVTMFAAQAIVAIPVRLAVGENGGGVAAFVGALAGGLVSTALVALFCIFTGRLYVATAGLPAAKDAPPAA